MWIEIVLDHESISKMGSITTTAEMQGRKWWNCLFSFVKAFVVLFWYNFKLNEKLPEKKMTRWPSSRFTSCLHLPHLCAINSLSYMHIFPESFLRRVNWRYHVPLLLNISTYCLGTRGFSSVTTVQASNQGKVSINPRQFSNTISLFSSRGPACSPGSQLAFVASLLHLSLMICVVGV